MILPHSGKGKGMKASLNEQEQIFGIGGQVVTTLWFDCLFRKNGYRLIWILAKKWDKNIHSKKITVNKSKEKGVTIYGLM